VISIKPSSLSVAAVCAVSSSFGLSLGCSSSSSPAAQVVDAGFDVAVPVAAACTTVVTEESCDTSRRPIVFVHGTYGSGDNFENIAAHLTSNGFCADHIVAVEYDSLGDSPGQDCTAPNTPQGCGKIDAAVNAILAKFPQFTQVDLAGHSQGTEHCGNYIGAGGVGAHADKIAHYINFSGVPDVGSMPTLSLSSQHDLDDTPHHATGTSICAFAELADGGTVGVSAEDGGVEQGSVEGNGAGEDGIPDGGDGGSPTCNVIQYTFVHQDHFAVAASKGSFLQVYRYLTGTEPQYTDVQCGDDPVTIEGLSETFADNVPVQGMVEVRNITTPQADAAPEQVITSDANGHFLTTLKRNAFYEFAGYAADGGLIGYQYFTPFKRSNRLVRFLSPASASDGSSVGGLIATETTNKATRSASSATVLARWAGGAFRQDLQATLDVNALQVLTSANTGAQAFTNSSLNGGVVGLFMEDKNQNGVSDLGLVDSAAFIAFTDVSIPATTPAFVQLTFTPGIEDTDIVGEVAVISNWPSKAALISVFFQ
jgi:hypothetical protein